MVILKLLPNLHGANELIFLFELLHRCLMNENSMGQHPNLTMDMMMIEA